MRSRDWLRTRRLALPLALAAVAVGGCGGGGDKTAPAPASTGTTAQRTGVDVQQRFIDVVREVSPAVVQIETGEGLGSGVVYDDQRHVVTNAHVVGASKSFTVTLAKGDRHKATLVGEYEAGDLAVIRLEDGSPPVATFGDSAKLRVGELVLAMGNPLGLRSSVTQGIVSSLGRTVSEGGGAVIASAVQTSAAINPGNSGGALVDLDGDVIGIPTLAARTGQDLGGGQAAGIGFAIPSNTVKRIAAQLIESGHVTSSGRAFLGVSVASTTLGEGVLVGEVQKGGPAERAGIRAHDLILKVAGKPTPTIDDLATVLADRRPGQRVPVAVQHPNGKKATVTVRLGESPA